MNRRFVLQGRLPVKFHIGGCVCIQPVTYFPMFNLDRHAYDFSARQ